VEVEYIKSRHIFITPEGEFTPDEMVVTYLGVWDYADEQALIVKQQQGIIRALRKEVNLLKKELGTIITHTQFGMFKDGNHETKNSKAEDRK